MGGADTFCLTVLEKKGLHQVAGLKPMEGKKLEVWCDTVRARVENILDTLPVHSSTMSEFQYIPPRCRNLCQATTVSVMERTTPISQRMTWRSWMNSQVLRTVHTLHQEGVGTMDILLESSHTLSQKYRTCPNPPLLWTSLSVTHSILSPLNHIPMVHQLQLL